MGDRPEIICPIKVDTHKIQLNSQGLFEAMQKLRTDLESCPECPNHKSCPVLENINASVTNALQEIIDEWGLEQISYSKSA